MIMMTSTMRTREVSMMMMMMTTTMMKQPATRIFYLPSTLLLSTQTFSRMSLPTTVNKNKRRRRRIKVRVTWKRTNSLVITRVYGDVGTVKVRKRAMRHRARMMSTTMPIMTAATFGTLISLTFVTITTKTKERRLYNRPLLRIRQTRLCIRHHPATQSPRKESCVGRVSIPTLDQTQNILVFPAPNEVSILPAVPLQPQPATATIEVFII
mmetsp:Transcript_22438/g.52967  ORF Transcript_22438/g.52967 Transcript_22438/m.52967 type:complete len:211 (-) Transcript_22438:3041-3673(-)